MDGSGTSVASKRQSALPRFGATKLPTSGLKSPTATTGIPAPRPTSIARPPPPSSWNASGVDQSKASSNGVPSTPNTRARTNPSRLSNGQNNMVPRPVSRQAGMGIRPPSASYSSDNDYSTGIYGFRRDSLQDSEHSRNISSEGSEQGSSSTAASAADDVSPVKKLKPRPSLSDRTIESLRQVPASPSEDRRRTSFFGNGSQSPSTPRRPVSQMAGIYPGPKSAHSTNKTTGLVRPASPSKRPVTSYGGVTPARKSVSSAFPKPPAVTVPSTTALPRSHTPTAIARRSSIVYPGPAGARSATSIAAARQARPQSTIVTSRMRPTSPTKIRPPSPSKLQAPSPTKRASVTGSKSAAAPVPAEPLETADVPSPTSSAALRQQIAQARAAAKAAAKKEQEAQAALDKAGYNLDDDDPFNQKPKDGKDQLRRRLDDARRDGRLNISAMALKAIPDEVMGMYDTEAMEASTVTWSECVDLVRLNAADNDLTEVADHVFPDRPAEELAEDGNGNQFGGLEALDFHGNRLMSIPPGIRQLGRLTVLNLSRNNLDNLAIDIITQVTTLKQLYLGHNSLSDELPGSISRLTSLEILDISSNRLSQLPRNFRELLYLKTLNVCNNRLTSIPFEQLAVLPKLAEVSASANALTGALFPSSVKNMNTLSKLDVSDNAIASFNFAKVLNCPSLVRLDVSRNRIGIFPDISQWSELTTLVADENALSAFPAGLTSLKDKLRIVSLERNSLREIDEGVAGMTALEQLNVGGNPIRERKLLGMETHQIKEEMERKRQLANDLGSART